MRARGDGAAGLRAAVAGAARTRSNRPGAASQDRVAVVHLGNAMVVVLADGAGGMRGGGHAAEVAVQHVLGDLAQLRGEAVHTRLVARLAEADLLANRDPHAGETTAVVVVVTTDGIVGASCGDSGAWLVEGDGHEDLTGDQHRKLRLGSGRASPVPFARKTWTGTLLVASDGVFSHASTDAIVRASSGADLDAAATALIALVRLPSGSLPDDVAVAMVRRTPLV